MKGNYVIAPLRTESGSTLIFGRVTSTEDGMLTVRQEKNCHIKPVSHQVLAKHAVDLGEKPIPGKVHGFNTSVLYRGKTAHDLGNFHWFYKPEDKKLPKQLADAVAQLIERCEKLRLPLPEEDSICWEIHKATGAKQHLGLFKQSRDLKKQPHTLAFRPELLGEYTMLYVLAHEYAHWLYFNHVVQLSHVVSDWVKAFNRSVKTVEPTVVPGELLDDWFESGLEPLQFRKGLEPLQRKCFDDVLKAIRKASRVDPYDLTSLFLAGKKKSIRRMWEAAAYRNMVEVNPILTDYATTNVKELFAESFAFYIAGMKIQDDEVKALVKTTISTIKV